MLSSFFVDATTVLIPREVIGDSDPLQFIARYSFDDNIIKLDGC